MIIFIDFFKELCHNINTFFVKVIGFEKGSWVDSLEPFSFRTFRDI